MKVCRESRGVVLLIHNLGTTALPLGKNPSTHLLEGCMGLKASLDDLEKRKILLPLPELEPRIVHPVS
jgi:hypothetical protein